MKKAIDLIMLFLDEVSMEDISQMKYTLPDSQIEAYLEEWITENAINLISEHPKQLHLNSTAARNGFNLDKTIPLKKTFHLKVTVEREELRADGYDENPQKPVFNNKDEVVNFMSSLLNDLIEKNG